MTSKSHTLIIVEENIEEDPEVYQASLVGHPPDDIRTTAVKKAKQEIVSIAESETGIPHKLTVKHGPPSDMQEEYNQYDDYTDEPLVD